MLRARQFHDVILLRNFHDLFASDIPVVQTDWPEEKLQLALEYWEDLSKDNWSEAEKLQKCKTTLPISPNWTLP